MPSLDWILTWEPGLASTIYNSLEALILIPVPVYPTGNVAEVEFTLSENPKNTLLPEYV